MKTKKKITKSNKIADITLDNFNIPTYQSIRQKIASVIGDMPGIPIELGKGVWSEQALKVLGERYLRKDGEGDLVETPEEMCWRVSWEVASSEALQRKTKKEIIDTAKSFYKLLISRKFLPNSPTLMNAGTGNNLQYSACFVLPVADSLEGIFDAVKYQALIHQTGGGTGFSFSRLRPQGDLVKSSNGVASGPVSFMRVFDAATNEIKQGGRRRGANMGILRVDHPDIMEFIHCKEEGGITNFNISVAITDEFMKAFNEDKEYNLINPKTNKVVGQLSAKKIFNEIAEGAWRTGDPGIIFLDRANKGTANPVPSLGPVEATNPCVTGDTLVSTTEGLIKMEEVVKSHFKGGIREGGNMGLFIDNRVFGKKEEGITQTRATKFFDNGLKDVFRVETKHGFDITVTGDHKLLTNKGWIETNNLKKGDILLVQSGEGNFGGKSVIDYKNIKGNNYPTTWNNKLGETLGYLVGDGWVKTGDKNCRVGFTFNKENINLINYLKNNINAWYGVNIEEVERNGKTIHLSYHKKEFVNYFLRLGIKAVRAQNKEVPISIYKAPKDAVIGFLRGLFSADGTIGFNKKHGCYYIRLTSKSQKLLKGVQQLLINLGIISRIYNRSRASQTKFNYVTKNGTKRSYISDGVLYELNISRGEINTFLEKIGFLADLHKEKITKLKSHKLSYKTKYETEVFSITPAGKQRVYDLTEEKSFTFITNGLISYDCGEQPLYPYDACNLGSIFLTYFVKEINGKPEVDWEELRNTAKLAIRFLDNVIDVNPYPLEMIRKTVLGIRRIGLGVGGWSDMLVALGISYDSEEALELAAKIMKTIQDEAIKASEQLAIDRGAFPFFEKSIYKNKTPRRNSTVTTIAPTGSISIIANASSGIEPLFAVAYQHIVKDKHLDRTLTFFNPDFERVMENRGLWNEDIKKKVSQHGTVRGIAEIPDDIRNIFGTAHDITPDWHIKTQAAFQKYTENAVSKTVNLSHDATVEDIKSSYLKSWETGCKGITVFRDGCKDVQVLNLGIKDKVEEVKPKEVTEVWTRPTALKGSTYKIKTPVGTAFITINEDQNQSPVEVFINVGRAGSDVQAMAEALGRLISKSLKFASSLTTKERAMIIIDQLRGIGGRRAVGFGPNRILSLPDAIAVALSSHLGMKFNHTEEPAIPSNGNGNGKIHLSDFNKEKTELNTPVGESFTQLTIDSNKVGDICPSCGSSSFVYEEGCSKCHACGHSEC